MISPMSNSTAGARALQGALGLVLATLGLVFTALLWLSFIRAQETRRWMPTPCVITRSQVISENPSPNSPLAHRAEVRYRYTFAGNAHDGGRIHRVDGPTSEKQRAAATCQKYPPGLETTCYVNPAQPDFAVLEHDTRAGLYTLWFPLLFVAGGAGMAWTAWKAKEQRTKDNLP